VFRGEEGDDIEQNGRIVNSDLILRSPLLQASRRTRAAPILRDAAFGRSSEPDRKCIQHQALSNQLKTILFFVMAGLVPAIHVFLV
jgi:hypothetical protein